MGNRLVKHLESAQYNRKLFYLDNGAEDLPPIIDNVSIQPGSECRSLTNGDKWILNTHYEWVHVLDGHILHDVPFEPAGKEYVRKTADDGHGYWVPTHFVEEEKFNALVKDLQDGLYSVSDFDEKKTYVLGQEVIYKDTLYSCAVGKSTPGPFKANEWNEINKEPGTKTYTNEVLYHAGDLIILDEGDESYLVRVSMTHVGSADNKSLYLETVMRFSTEFDYDTDDCTVKVHEISSQKIKDAALSKTQAVLNSEFDKTIKANKQSSDSADEQIRADLNTTKDTLNTKIDSEIKSLKQTHEADTDTLDQKIDTQVTLLNQTIASQKSTLEQSIESTKTQLEQLIEALTETVASNKDLATQSIGAVDKTVSSNKATVDRSLKDLQDLIASLQTTVSNVQSTLTAQGQDIVDATSTASSAKSTADTLSSRVNSLSSSISTLQSDVSSLKNRVTALEQRL